jgi:chemotaxis protein CheZ
VETFAVQRKVFRIEEMAGHGERRRVAASTPAVTDREIAQSLDLIARHKRDLAALIHEGKHRRMTLAAGELGAAVESMETATQKILKSTEGVDDNARALGAALKSDYERSLAQDIQEQVVHIYEACNFQDLAGQRIGKVIEMLGMVEAQLTAMAARCNGGDVPPAMPAQNDGGLINGPKLDGAAGHVSQRDIDMLFG